MKRNLFVFLLIFILVGATVGLACDCCPAVGSVSDLGSILNTPHDCCPKIDLNREKCGIEQTNSFIPISLRTLIFQDFSLDGIFPHSTPLSLPSNFRKLGSSFVPSKTPLYLTHQILRI